MRFCVVQVNGQTDVSLDDDNDVVHMTQYNYDHLTFCLIRCDDGVDATQMSVFTTRSYFKEQLYFCKPSRRRLATFRQFHIIHLIGIAHKYITNS